MLKRMKTKPNWTAYTFGECCLIVLMILGASFSIFGMIAAFAVALATHSFQPLIWLIPCGAIAVVCCGGLMYVNDSDDFDDSED